MTGGIRYLCHDYLRQDSLRYTDLPAFAFRLWPRRDEGSWAKGNGRLGPAAKQV